MSFTKLHGTIVYSSIWAESSDTRVVWITMLAIADMDGVVQASVSGLARCSVVSEDACRQALDNFLAPDPDSRDGTTGERIEKVPGGWLIINHANYRDKRTREQVLTAARVARHRAKRKKVSVTDNVTECYKTDVTPDNAKAPSEAEAEADAEKNKSAASASASKPVKRSRKPGPIWDAVICVFKLNPVTKSDKTRIGKVVRDLKDKKATPDLIISAASRYQKKWPNVVCTPEALLKHWETFTTQPSQQRDEKFREQQSQEARRQRHADDAKCVPCPPQDQRNRDGASTVQ